MKYTDHSCEHAYKKVKYHELTVHRQTCVVPESGPYSSQCLNSTILMQGCI